MIIELGCRGDYTRAVQRIIGVPASKVDGKCGPLTVAFMKIWQTRRGIEADGVFGPLSRAAVHPGDLIKPYEGLSLRAYDDSQDVPLARRLIRRVGNEWRRDDGTICRRYPTIGWGRRLWPGEWVETCTVKEADQWFEDFLIHQLGDAMTRYVTPDRDACFRAAVYSLGYNGGPGAIVRLAGANFDPMYWRAHKVTSAGSLDHGLIMRRAEEAALAYAGDT